MVGPAGTIAGRAGVITSATDSLQIGLFGRGAHGSMPQASIDPVVMAAATVMRLQTIVSRELAAAEAAVVTIGSLQAGTKENVIPDEAVIKLNVRSFDDGVRRRVLAAIERIVKAEAAASGAPRPPEITPLDRYPWRSTTPRRAGGSPTHSAGIFPPTGCARPGPAPASEDSSAPAPVRAPARAHARPRRELRCARMSTRTSRRHILDKFAHGQVAVNLRACLVSAGTPRANDVGKKNRSMTDIIDGTAYMMLVTCNARSMLLRCTEQLAHMC